MLKILGGFAVEAATTALSSYGLIALAAVFFPSFGPLVANWIFVPVVFVSQFAMKVAFSRDARGKLKPTNAARNS
ncbi:hypothetical protein [Rhizobium sp. PP-CC-3G-465]|uniref:hypothetical protein n=1 Tax=Rhizobium sp. PP-CC-3G-465 TaxID=2135648 RepID=UPI001042ABD6|nr:hypothetical protein C8J33_12415 [Rhizobium sp. PP-CC-3G-465]